MKNSILGLVALLMAAVSVSAAQPGKALYTAAGLVFIDGNHRALYTFDNDKPDTSSCYGECAAAWPPYLANAHAKPEGDWTLVARTDGSRMWAYRHRPLYTYGEDKNPGDVNGNGVGGFWQVAKPKF